MKLLVLIFLSSCCLAGKALAQKAADLPYDFALLRQHDDLSLYATESHSSFYPGIRYLPLGQEGFLSFGGSYRGQYEYFNNETFEQVPQEDHAWYLQRLLLHTHLGIGRNFRLFAETGSSIVAGKTEQSPVDRDELYINQLFIQWQAGALRLSAGRENLKMGSRRLVDPREGPNVRRSFDHLSLRYQTAPDKYAISTFVSAPVRPRPGSWDNEALHGEEYFWGTYVSDIRPGKFIRADLYYLGISYEENSYALLSGRETRHSLGLRANGLLPKWGYDHEAVIQTGRLAGQTIFAWTISFNSWFRPKQSQQAGLKTELISGDGNGRTAGTFNAMYPRGAYFGRVARFGPANLIDLHPYWNIRKGKLFVELDYDVFWRFSTEDAVYDPALNVISFGPNDQRFIAQQLGTLFNLELSPFVSAELETNYIIAGGYLQAVKSDARNLLHAVFTLEARF